MRERCPNCGGRFDAELPYCESGRAGPCGLSDEELLLREEIERDAKKLHEWNLLYGRAEAVSSDKETR